MSAFSVTQRAGVAIVSFDAPGQAVNTLSKAAGWELDELLQRLEGDEVVKAVVFRSGKPDSFIAGADINEFAAAQTVEEATRLSREAQLLMQRVADAPKPIVAAIHGNCLGGGLELSLACGYRVASDHPKTQLGLPETQLGIIPGAGGCSRLPRLIGARAALQMILTARNEPAKKALRLGLVDEVVPEAILLDIAIDAAERMARGWKPSRRGRGMAAALLDGNPIGRMVVYRKARESVMQKTGGHYPAPLRAIDVVRTSLESGMTHGLAAESQAFGELAMTDVSRRLIEVFFATTALKKDNGVPAGMGHAQPVRRLGIVGSGFMGAGIAGTAALKAGVEARLKDSDLARVGRGLKAATDILSAQLSRGRMTRSEFDRKRSYLSGTATWDGFAGADLVIEAVFEDLATKQQVFAELSAVVPPSTVLASNTSTLPINEIAAAASHPERVLGHALLLAGREDAAPRSDSHRAHIG